jgi:hypothetical protein
MKDSSQSNISLELVENAVDSVGHAIELMAWQDISNETSRLKQAILSVAHGVELLLKERLRRVHPSLVWENVDHYPRLDARTVGVEKAIQRLSSIGAVPIAESDATLIRSLRNTRNAIEHFSWQTTREEVSLIIGQALSFAVDFAQQELGYDISTRFNRDDTWKQLIENSTAFKKAHEARLTRTPPSSEFAYPCDFCNAITISRYGGSCALCGHWNQIDQDEQF